MESNQTADVIRESNAEANRSVNNRNRWQLLLAHRFAQGVCDVICPFYSYRIQSSNVCPKRGYFCPDRRPHPHEKMDRRPHLKILKSLHIFCTVMMNICSAYEGILQKWLFVKAQTFDVSEYFKSSWCEWIQMINYYYQDTFISVIRHRCDGNRSIFGIWL